MISEEEIAACHDPVVIRLQLKRILNGSPFVRSNRIGKFLAFIVENTLDGNHENLKEICIGSAVFDRDPAYDPKIDPIVRVEARRLRLKLQEYYENEGITDTVLITLPKGGYRPVIELRAVPGSEPMSLLESTPVEPASASSTHSDLPHPSFQTSSILWPLIGVSLCLTLVGTFLLFKSYRGLRPGEERIAPLTSYIGQEFDPALSPDGHHLAFVWDGDGSNYDVYVKTLPNGDPIRITSNSAHDLHPSWSPDGRDLAVLRATPSGFQIVIVPSSRGPERVLGEVHSSVSVWKADALQMKGSLGPSWTPDGRAVVVSDGGAIYLWPIAYGERQKISSPPAGSSDFFPTISPDGKTLALVRQTSNSTSDLYTLELNQASSALRNLTQDKSDIRGLTWTPDSKSIVFSSNRQGRYGLWQTTVADRHLQPIMTNSAEAGTPSLSPDGHLIAFTELIQNTNIWRLSIGEKEPRVASRLIASSGRNNSPQYSPDGKQIAFVSDRTGSWELWISESDGSAPRQLTSFRGPMLGTPHWSPDAKWIAFDARPGEHSAVFVLSSSGGQPRRLSNNTFEERMPSWSHDGHYIYFNSNRDGSIRLWRMTSDGENPIPITTRTAYDSFESNDGRTIYFWSDGHGIWTVPSSGGEEHLIPELADMEPSRYIAITPHALFFVDHESSPRHVQAYDFKSHRTRTLGLIEHNLVSGTPSLSISPDEQYILYAQQDQSGSDILSLRWTSAF